MVDDHPTWPKSNVNKAKQKACITRSKPKKKAKTTKQTKARKGQYHPKKLPSQAITYSQARHHKRAAQGPDHKVSLHTKRPQTSVGIAMHNTPGIIAKPLIPITPHHQVKNHTVPQKLSTAMFDSASNLLEETAESGTSW